MEDRPRQSSSSDNENIPGFSGIPGTSTQSFSTVEDRPRQISSNDEKDVPMSGGMQSTMTQNFSTEESPSKRRRLDSGKYSLCLYHVKINLTYCTICSQSNFS